MRNVMLSKNIAEGKVRIRLVPKWTLVVHHTGTLAVRKKDTKNMVIDKQNQSRTVMETL